jgi:O-antigen ligase
LHVHNQILAIAVTLGIPAALFFIFSLWWPAYSMRKMRSVLYLSFFLIALLSFFDDDTLETQQGVTFYAFFNALLLYAMPFASAAFQSGNKNSPGPEAEK